MSHIVFLFPGSGPYEALDNWVFTVGRHAKKHEVFLARRPDECKSFDACFVLTEANSYPRVAVESDLRCLRAMSVPFAVVHNHDGAVPEHDGVPSPGDYPSFCWTQRAKERLSLHSPVLLRQPVFPPIVPFERQKTCIATFGHIEPKKQVREMYRWALEHDLPFRAIGPNVHRETYATYLSGLKRIGCEVILYPWAHNIEDLAPWFKEVSHFLFVLPQSKTGTGGSPTSPRYASLFNRPVIVIDDEDTFRQDGYYVFESLDTIYRLDEPKMCSPSYDWSPDAYLDDLLEKTLTYWRTK